MRSSYVPSSDDRLTRADPPLPDQMQWTFGALEGRLATAHGIAASKRTAFAARLKNFHRLGFPSDLVTAKGRQTLYSVGQVIEMALAVELTQLGLTPERVVRVLTLDPVPVFYAVRMAARSLLAVESGAAPHDELMPMYLYFDPANLAELTVDWNMAETPDQDRALSTFFYGGPGVVAEMLTSWTAGGNTRASFLNVTSMLDGFAGPHFSNGGGVLTEARKRFFEELIVWSEEYEETYADDDLAEGLYRHIVLSRPDLALGEHGQLAEARALIEAEGKLLNVPERLYATVELWLRSPNAFAERLEVDNVDPQA